MRNAILSITAVLLIAASACTNPASPLDTLRECDQFDRSANVTDVDALTRCDEFDRSQPIG